MIIVCRNFFDFQYVIGKGGFGKVWRVVFKKNQRLYALKEMSKFKIVQKRSVESINNERKFLEILSHPLIINMQFAFETKENLYLILDYFSGGDLRYHLGRTEGLTEKQTKFISNVYADRFAFAV